MLDRLSGLTVGVARQNAGDHTLGTCFREDWETGDSSFSHAVPASGTGSVLLLEMVSKSQLQKGLAGVVVC